MTRRLATMVEADQLARRSNAPWADIDRDNTTEVKGLLEIYGWFAISRWGARADRNAFLLVQHSPDLQLQKRVLRLLDALRMIGETEQQGFALLYDRVRLSKELPNGVTALSTDDGSTQRFGTQGTCVRGLWKPFPIEDPSHVDERRAAVGLPPLEQYRKLFHCP